MRYRPKGLTSEGRITAQGVLTRPTFANSRYVGIARAVVGTMMAPSTRLKPARSPRNRNLANPYPAAAASSAAPTALTTAYSMVLSIQCRKTPWSWVSVARMFDGSCGARENHSPNVLNRSCVLFVEATANQHSGSRKYARAASLAMVSGVLRRLGGDRRRVAVRARPVAATAGAAGAVVVMRSFCGSR